MYYSKINYFIHFLLHSKYKIVVQLFVLLIVYYCSTYTYCMNNPSFVQDEIQPFLVQEQIIAEQQRQINDLQAQNRLLELESSIKTENLRLEKFTREITASGYETQIKFLKLKIKDLKHRIYAR